MSFTDYADLFETFLKGVEARDPVTSDPRVMIWGTLEARVLGADRVILGGLNDGIWPAPVPADPWLNRPMREASGLLSPERKIGLSAHDFQQAVGAQYVVLTRAIRDDDAETVPSRWLNRLTNLMRGMAPDIAQGEGALDAMKARGKRFMDLARMLDTPPSTGSVAAAKRPAPVPPRRAQPERLSVTEITRLIRDPYAIYARHVLRLKRLEPLGAKPDSRLRGNVLHDVMEEFFKTADLAEPDIELQLRNLAQAAFKARVPWPEASLVWLRKFEGIIPEFVAGERVRQADGDIYAHEIKGMLKLEEIDFLLSCKADRIDRLIEGSARIWDYKTGAPPAPKDQQRAERQLYLEALLLANVASKARLRLSVSEVGYLKIGSNYDETRVDLSKFDPATERDNLLALLSAYVLGGQGYVSRRMPMATQNYEGDYDHLARFGEWLDVDEAERIDLT